MNARKRQAGQALVAALATMALLFAMAGGLAVAVSAALSGTAATPDPYLRDTQAGSATAAIVATVAGGASGCPSPSTVSAAFGLSPNAYACDSMDLVAPAQVAMVPFKWSGTCAGAPLGTATHASLWLHAIRALGSFFVDGNRDSCAAGAGACTGTSNISGPGLFYNIADCNLAAFGTPYAHVAGPNGAVSVVRLAPLASFISAPGSPWSVDQGAGPIASAALRGPGRPLDLVVASRTSGTITAWLGAGDGTFRLSQTITTPADVSALTLADLNGDGLPDLAFTSFQRSLVSVWFGNGDGTFSNNRDYPVGAGPVGVVAGPLTSADRVDLAIASATDRSVTILPGTGGGRFASATGDCDIQGRPTSLVAVSFAGSGTYLAVAKAASAGLISVYSVTDNGNGNGNGGCRGNGNGNGNGNVGLREIQSYALAGGPGAMTAAHFTRSGQPDLAVALPNQNQVQVLLGSGSGQFQIQAAFDVGGSPSAISAARFGYSATDDLAVTKASGAASVLTGNGGGAFRPVVGGDIPVSQGPAGIATGDFDGSGAADLAVSSAAGGQLSVFLRNRSRVFSILASAGGVFNEADLIWANPTRTDTLFFEGGLQ